MNALIAGSVIAILLLLIALILGVVGGMLVMLMGAVARLRSH